MEEKVLLGEGAFSKVYKQKINNEYVAIKIYNPCKKQKHLKDAAKEKQILESFKQSQHIINMIDIIDMNEMIKEDEVCFELLSDELLNLIENYGDNDCQMPIKVVKNITKQILHGLSELKNHSIIHADLKPENILLTQSIDHKLFIHSRYQNINDIFKVVSGSYTTCIRDTYPKKINAKNKKKFKNHSEQVSDDINDHIDLNYHVLRELLLKDIQVKISDLGNAIPERKYKPKKYLIGTREYRSPEILLQAHCDASNDMWSLGCIVYEMLTGDLLFQASRDNDMSCASHHLALMIQTLGDFPKDVIQRGKKRKYFAIDEDQVVHKFQYLIGKHQPIQNILYKYHNFSKEESLQIENFLLPMFEYDPQKRIIPEDCLKSAWLNF
jgi:serine/threonine-protein kinase SRPK3